MFNRNWASDSQIKGLVAIVRKVQNLEGKLIEIGCWEGRSTVAIANECFPENLDAVDTWKGSVSESPNHETVVLASQRDIFGIFKDNIKSLTRGNVIPYQQDCFAYLSTLKQPVKFCYIDASHDYKSVKRTIEMLLPKLVNNAILCGDDYYSANIDRKDLSGGVQRAVIEMCPIHTYKCSFWIYKHSTINRFLLRSTTVSLLITLIRKYAYRIKTILHSVRRNIKR
jgi:hypothetical protein